MSTHYTEVRGQAMGIDSQSTAPSPTAEIGAGRIYVDTTTGKLYIWTGSAWRRAVDGTTTSTTSSSTSSTSSSTSSTSSSSTSSTSSSSSTSSTSSSTSTTLF